MTDIERAIARANVLRFEAFARNDAELHRQASAQVSDVRVLAELERCRTLIQETTRRLTNRRDRR